MKKNFVLIAVLVAALTVVFVSCGDDSVVDGTGEPTFALSLFAAETGQTGLDIKGVNKATFDEPNGTVNLLDTSGSAGFALTVKDAKADSTITIKYICNVKAGAAKFTLKKGILDDGSWFDTNGDATAGAAEGNQYQDLKAGEVADLVLKASGFTKPTTYCFQRNGDTNAFQMKIISVTLK
jgi:hypothetical protein